MNWLNNNIKGMAVYFALATLLGIDVAVLALIIKENSDRIAYYEGKWNEGDIIRGCCAIALAWVVLLLVTCL